MSYKSPISNFTLMLGLLLLFSSCSSAGSNTVFQSENSISNLNSTEYSDLQLPELISNSEDSDRELLGMYTALFDAECKSASIQPDRTNSAHYNITRLVPVEITINEYDPVTYIWLVVVKIVNPYPVSAYDVRLIIYTDNSSNALILPNPDGWTNLWDVQGGFPINPFFDYYTESNGHEFTANSYRARDLRLCIPPGNPVVKFAIDASYPGNCEEPYSITFFSNSRLTETQGDDALAEVHVSDWQNDVSQVVLYNPEFTNNQVEYFNQIEGNIWRGNILNKNGSPPGSYPAVIRASSADLPGVYIYDFVNIRVKKDVIAKWSIFYYKMELSHSNNDFEEMEEAGIVDGELNVVGVVDEGDFIDIWEVRNQNEEQNTFVSDMGEVITDDEINMSDPELATNFLRWAIREYPAEKYGMICYGHGNGGIYYFPPERGMFNDMPIEEFAGAIRIALDDYPSVGKLDFIAFESCTMSFLEMAYGLKDVCKVAMASEFMMGTPGAQFYYLLTDLLANIDSIDAYGFAELFIQNLFTHTFSTGIYAAWDSDLVNSTMIPAINNFAQELIDALPEFRDDITACRTDSDDWGDFCTDFRITDIGYFAEKVAEHDPPLLSELVQTAIDLRNAIDTAIVAFDVDTMQEGCYGSGTGWQILFTDHFRDPDPDYQYVRDVITNIGFADVTLWDEFLTAYDINDY